MSLRSDSEGLPSEEELESGEEEEEGSEEGSEEEGSEEEGSEEGSDEDEDEKPRRPAKRRKAELPPPGREMPQRTTRGQRMGALVKDAEEEQADEQFWNQEFFAEEERDEVYETESEPEDVVDADFSESEAEEDDEDEAEAEARAKEPKKKALKPPGYKKPPLPPRSKPPGGAGGAGGGKAGAPRKRAPCAESGERLVLERRTVRESTRQKVAEAAEERKLQEMLKPRRVIRHSSHRPLTQGELLAEAAKTEIENTKSLQMLVALEEQTKKKAEVKKAKYAGPMVRYRSKACEGQERSTMEVRNMQTPPELLPKSAPPPPPKPVCAVTGLPARYRDPRTGLPYATLEAYKVLQQQYQQRAQQYPGAPGGGLPPGMPQALQWQQGAGPPGGVPYQQQQWQQQQQQLQHAQMAGRQQVAML